MRSYPTMAERQAAIGRGKYLIGRIAKEFNATHYPTPKEADAKGLDNSVETYAANHGRRMKKSDILMAEQLWTNHLYTACSNEIPALSKTSRHAIKETGGERSRHLTRKMGKLVDAGIIFGSPSQEREYADQYATEGARGYGYKPLTDQAYKGFTFYWTPEFLTLVAERLPEVYRVVPTPRTEIDSPQLCGPRCALKPRDATKSDTYICHLPKTVRNEEMSKGASPDGEGSPEEGKRRKGEGRRKAVTEFPAGMPEKEKSAPALDFSVEEMMNKKGSAAALTRHLLTSGQILMANAVILVQLYLQKLAPLTGRTYHPKAVETAIYRAADLLARYPEASREKAFDEFRQTIDRVQQRLERGGGFFIVTPDKWFDPDYQANIYMHYQHYLVPFRKRREEMNEWQRMKDAAKAQEETHSDDWARTNDRYSGLAWSMKHYLRNHHKSDNRLHNANLLRWTAEIRAMVRKDGIGYQEAVDVAQWLLTSKHKTALWWLNESCFGAGIRSPRSFRKHFAKIQCAYIEAKHGGGRNSTTYN